MGDRSEGPWRVGYCGKIPTNIGTLVREGCGGRFILGVCLCTAYCVLDVCILLCAVLSLFVYVDSAYSVDSAEPRMRKRVLNTSTELTFQHTG